MKRVLAWIAIVVMCAVVIITCITGVTGSKYFFGMLFMCMIVPVLLWAMMFFAGLFNKRGEELAEEQKKKDTADGTDDQSREKDVPDKTGTGAVKIECLMKQKSG